MITLKINVSRLDKTKFFKGEKGTYCDLVLFDNKAGKDSQGNDGFVAQGVTQEERQNGVRGAIVGNWKHVGGKPKSKVDPEF